MATQIPVGTVMGAERTASERPQSGNKPGGWGTERRPVCLDHSKEGEVWAGRAQVTQGPVGHRQITFDPKCSGKPLECLS